MEYKQKDILIDKSRCVGCGMCCDVCTGGALYVEGGVAVYNQYRCTVCGFCEEVECPTDALTILDE